MTDHNTTDGMFAVRVSGRMGFVEVKFDDAFRQFVEPCGGTVESFLYALQKFGRWHGREGDIHVNVEPMK